MTEKKDCHPHFDEGLIVWSDEYSGKYPPPGSYSEEFDLQWKLAIEGEQGYFDNPGASTEDEYINDRVYEWTGKSANGHGFHDKRMGSRVLDHPLDPDLIKGKKCIDIGCGLGRWTRTMLAIGADSVLSVDMSKSGLKNISKYNDNTAQADIMRIPEEHPEWVGQFDFANFWGVPMCTHDPKKAFLSAASTVKPGGSMYLMVYCPEGMHNHPVVNYQRRTFHNMKTVDERLAYVDHVFRKEWDSNYTLAYNLRNQLIRLGAVFNRNWRDSKVGFLDLLEPTYNWVIPKNVIDDWMKQAGFTEYHYLYKKPRSAYHVLATKK